MARKTAKQVREENFNIPTVTVTVNRETRQVSVKIENFDGVPATALDRVDVLIEKELYKYHAAMRQRTAEETRQAAIIN